MNAIEIFRSLPPCAQTEEMLKLLDMLSMPLILDFGLKGN